MLEEMTTMTNESEPAMRLCKRCFQKWKLSTVCVSYAGTYDWIKVVRSKAVSLRYVYTVITRELGKPPVSLHLKEW